MAEVSLGGSGSSALRRQLAAVAESQGGAVGGPQSVHTDTAAGIGTVPGNASGGAGAANTAARPASGIGGGTMAGSMKWAAADAAFQRLGQKDIESLTYLSSSKALALTRGATYHQKPISHDAIYERVMKAIQPKSAATAPLEELPRLERCLESGQDARHKSQVLWSRKAMIADDLAAAMVRRGSLSSLDWIDVDGLDAELDDEEVDAGTEDGDDANLGTMATFNGQSPPDVTRLHSTATSPTASRPASRGAPETTSRGRILGLSAAKWLGTDGGRNHPALQKRRWPSMAKFERYYDVPEEYLPPRPPELVKEPEPLPEPRPTIAGIEESTSFAAQAYLWPALFETRDRHKGHDHIPLDQQPRPQKPANVFEAGALYRQACAQMNITPLSPVPVFGERVEIRDTLIDGTKQCYAIAEAVRACAAKELLLENTFMIDMGAARVVESAIRGGRLAILKLSGCCLSYRTCTALHDCLRMRGGASLTELSLSKCGLGGDLDVDPSELPDLSAAAYSRGQELLDLAIEAAKDQEPVVLDDDEDSTFNSEAVAQSSSTSRSVSKVMSPSRSGSKLKSNSRTNSKLKSIASRSGSKAKSETASQIEDEDGELPPPKPLLLPLLGLFAQRGTALRRLNLFGTALSIETVICLSSAVATTPIEALNLNQCSLDDHALSFIAEGVTKNRSLLELSIRKNPFSGVKGVMNTLLDIVGRHVRIAHLDIAENELPREMVEELCAAFKWSCSLVSVHMLGGGVSGHDAAEIFRVCKAWTKEHATDETVKAMDPPQPSPTEELVLCRALHVRGLSSWRIVLPAEIPAEPAPAKAAAMESVSRSEKPVSTSWMPACCWICHKAASIQYHWVVPDRGLGDGSGVSGARVFVRPSFANFERIELIRQRVVGAKRVCFASSLLAPPGQHCHIFESDVGDTRMLLCSQDEPSVESARAPLTDEQRDTLASRFREYRYSGPINVLPRIEDHGFQISEQLSREPQESPDIDPWANDALRQQRLKECYEADLRILHMGDLCRAEEEAEVKQTLWDIYHVLYETYVIFAGRSQWPLVRQVDVYGFFEEARLLNRNGPDSGGGYPDSPEPSPPTTPPALSKSSSAPLLASPAQRRGAALLLLQDVQQFLIQTVAARKRPQRFNRRGSMAEMRGAAIQEKARESAPLTRPQFIEVMLRSALSLWSVTDTSAAHAFRWFSETILLGRVMLPPLSPFPRGLTSQVGDVSDTLLARRKTLREAWERFGGSENSFQQLSQLLKLCDRYFTAKHVASIYALSRRPRADLQASDKPAKGLAYEEFCEAIARLALIWQRGSRLPGVQPSPLWPPQPQVGRPVPQHKIAARLEAFLAKLAERLRPKIRSTPF